MATRSATTSASGPATTRELVGLGTVIDSGKGPQLCVGAVATSLPPQCDGPPITNWDWARAPQSDSANGVRWGAYAVIGTYDGTHFTLTRPVTTPEAFTGKRPPDPSTADYKTPCPTPSGGWRVLDASRTNQEALDAALAQAERLPGYAGSWVDQSINDADGNASPEAMNDPTKLILDVLTTGDIPADTAVLRRTWGGSLCVSRGKRTVAGLQSIQLKITDDPALKSQFLSDGVNYSTGAVDLQVIWDDGAIQHRMDAAYGKGLVRVTSTLFPYVAKGS